MARDDDGVICWTGTRGGQAASGAGRAGFPLGTWAWYAAKGGQNATNMVGLLEWALVELVGEWLMWSNQVGQGLLSCFLVNGGL